MTWQGRRRVPAETGPDPQIKEPPDAINRVTATNICGSDLHSCEVLDAFITPGDICGSRINTSIGGLRRGVAHLSEY